MTTRRVYLSWMVLITLLVIVVGALGAAPHAAAQATAAVQATTAATASAATPAVIAFGPGPFNLQPSTGLADLKGYQATLNIDFKGNTGGQPNPWSATLSILVQGKSSARALTATFKGKAPLAASVPAWSAAMNGLFYRRAADGTCLADILPAQADPNVGPLVPEPADFLPAVIGAEDAGTKTVNGVAATGYRFDERALGEAGQAKGTGEVWVAATGGYVLKYSLTLQHGDGTLTWAYDLTKADQATDITLPKDCPDGLVDAPVMDDAKNVHRVPGITLFTTPSTAAQVADFYQKQLSAAGWKLDGKPIITDKGGVVSFKQGKAQLTVVITVGTGGTAVQLLLATT